MGEPESVHAIILGGARGVRHVDPAQSYPTSLHELAGGRVLDWLLRALGDAGVPNERVRFIGGYHIEKVVASYPGIHYAYHARWAEEGDAGALAVAGDDLQGTIVIARTEVVLRAPAILQVLRARAPVAVGWIGSGPERIPAVMRLQGPATSDLRAAVEASRRDASWTTLVDALGMRHARADVDVSDHAATITRPSDLARFTLGTKAETLERLRPMLKRAIVLDQVRFTGTSWRSDTEAVRTRILARFPHGLMAVRSTSPQEDGWASSEAGRYTSVLAVDPHDGPSFAASVERVLRSYEDAHGPAGLDFQVFVQPYLSAVTASGVLFTRDPSTGGPYYVLTLDRVTGRTDEVTSGRSSEHRTFVVQRRAQTPPPDADVRAIVEVAQEVEAVVGHDRLDLEFALGQDGQCYLLQVRPLAESLTKDRGVSDADLHDALTYARAFLADASRRTPDLAGRRTLLSNMADWNPAEMVGTAPRALALSLYDRLVTDEAWARGRSSMGYRNVRGRPLLVRIGGLPYVDVRSSFNSFLPASIDDELAEKLVDVWLDALDQTPSLHDKVEFEVATTCFSFDLDIPFARLRAAGLTAEEVERFRRALVELTDRIVRQEVTPIASELARTKRLPEALVGPRRLHRLLSSCHDLGTVPFSVLARQAFVAIAMLRSLTSRGILSQSELDRLFAQMPTVAHEVSAAVDRLGAGSLSREEFLAQFGHLRPGTYEITSLNYRSFPETAFQAPASALDPPAPVDGSGAQAILDAHADAIRSLLSGAGFRATYEEWRAFVLAAIPAREAAKFAFSRLVDATLETIAERAHAYGLSRDAASHIPIGTFLRLETESPSSATGPELRRQSGFESKRHEVASALRLPALLRDPDDVESFQVLPGEPTFVTSGKVCAPVVEVASAADPKTLWGRVVLIESADPGYDWIFAHPIAGLATRHGGAGSHMAIRAGEFSLPGAIGCGDALYERLLHAKLVEIDGTARTIRVVA